MVRGKKLVVSDKVNRYSDDRVHNDVEIRLPATNEADITLLLPNGEKIVLQYRLESPSIDICIGGEQTPPVACTNWIGFDMKSAPVFKGCPAHIRKVNQVVLDLLPEWLEPADKE